MKKKVKRGQGTYIRVCGGTINCNRNVSHTEFSFYFNTMLRGGPTRRTPRAQQERKATRRRASVLPKAPSLSNTQNKSRTYPPISSVQKRLLSVRVCVRRPPLLLADLLRYSIRGNSGLRSTRRQKSTAEGRASNTASATARSKLTRWTWDLTCRIHDIMQSSGSEKNQPKFSIYLRTSESHKVRTIIDTTTDYCCLYCIMHIIECWTTLTKRRKTRRREKNKIRPLVEPACGNACMRGTVVVD